MRVVRGRNSPASLLKWMRELNYGTGIRDSMIEKALTQLIADGRVVTDIVGRNERRQPLEGLLPKGHQWRTDVALEDAPAPEDEEK